MEELKIVLEKAVFFARQNVSGTISLRNNQPLKFRGVTLNLTGKAKASWSESDGDGSSTYSKKEPYFRQQSLLVGSGREEMVVDGGQHRYPFNFNLPRDIPSSFEGEHGYVRYCLSAVVDRPWRSDLETTVPLNVVALVDLNNIDPPIAEPATASQAHMFSCTAGVVNVVLSLPTGGVVPGQTLRPTLEVEDNSNASLRRVRLKLVQIVTYKASASRRKVCTK
ncbi:arrestin domain-containing protein 17-like isoform X2 [Neocloeon triangulifer]|uniref:arrestin domain-containing protein 17-like isoform X2 n=1 Tax=Neocloeon triangulifer TaxID=2078957 RepID=UPI00286F0F43|nr:arrestin domain-containing protein 17-like isoform X2 [Neocloeon triangulifer]